MAEIANPPVADALRPVSLSVRIRVHPLTPYYIALGSKTKGPDPAGLFASANSSKSVNMGQVGPFFGDS
jgi:hypothetical protein